jgi:hypothetical protein
LASVNLQNHFLFENLNFDVTFGQYITSKKKRLLNIGEQPFFRNELVQNCTQKNLKKIILLHIFKNFTEFDNTSKKSSPHLDRLLA